jgi:hypothetical protein
MKKTHVFIVFGLFAALVTGCAAPKPKPEVSATQGVKLRDLRSPDAAERGLILPSAVDIEASTYSVPADQYDAALQAILPVLVTGRGIVKNADDFGRNGLVAAIGTSRPLDEIKAILNQSGVRSVRNNYYSIYDEKGNDIDMCPIGAATVLQYVRSGKQSAMTVKPGALVWRISAKRAGTRGSACKLTMVPVWKPASDSSFVERASGVSRDISLVNSGIEVTAQAGDLVLTGPLTAKRQDRLGETMMVTPNGREVLLTIVRVTGITSE